MNALTMSQAAALLGLPKPAAHRQRVCAACEGELVETHVPDETRYAYLRDYERLGLVCEDCGQEAES